MRRRVAKTALLAASFLAFHAYWGSTKIEIISAADYQEYASDLRDTESWRYGFVIPAHGARLVKTPTAGVAGQAIQNEVDSFHAEIREEMLSELEAIPTRAALEAGFYILLALTVGWLLPALADRLRARFKKARVLAVGCVAAAAAFAALQPLLWLGYGAPLFTSLEGPGATSYSTMLVMTGLHGRTVSYRPFVEAVSLFPCWLAWVLGLNQVLPSMKVTTFVSLVTPSVCGILALAVAWYIPQVKPLAKAALTGLRGED